MSMNSLAPVFRRKIQRTIEYWEYFQVAGEHKLKYLEQDGSKPTKVIIDGIAKYTVLETWDVVKDPERAAVLAQGIVNQEEV